MVRSFRSTILTLINFKENELRFYTVWILGSFNKASSQILLLRTCLKFILSVLIKICQQEINLLKTPKRSIVSENSTNEISVTIKVGLVKKF